MAGNPPYKTIKKRSNKSMDKKMHFCILYIILFFSLISFLILSLGVIYFPPLSCFDQSIVLFWHKIALAHSLNIPLFITSLGYENILYISFLALILFAFAKKYKEGLLVALIIESNQILSTQTKLLFHRARPAIELHLTSVTDYSFPSGHSLMSMCFYGIMIYFAVKFIKNIYLQF